MVAMLRCFGELAEPATSSMGYGAARNEAREGGGRPLEVASRRLVNQIRKR